MNDRVLSIGAMRRCSLLVVAVVAACSNGGATTGSFAGVMYAIEMPPGFKLTSERADRLTWMAAGSPVEIQLVSSPPVSTCPPPQLGTGGESAEIDGVRRETAVFSHRCREGHEVMCAARNPAGFAAGERETMVAACSSLTLR